MRAVESMDRRRFVKGAALAGAAVFGGFVAASCSSEPPHDVSDSFGGPTPAKELPPAQPDAQNDFGIDANVNMTTIDGWLDRDDVVYRDARMLLDPADFGAIGGDSLLSATIDGFKIVPFPFLATVPPLPVGGAYTGATAWSVEWAADNSVVRAAPNYNESQLLIEQLFPKDKAVFIMCGAGGYAGLTRTLLVHLGWSPEKVYNVGGFWSYAGKRAAEFVTRPQGPQGPELCCLWQADCAAIDFTTMHPLAS